MKKNEDKFLDVLNTIQAQSVPHEIWMNIQAEINEETKISSSWMLASAAMVLLLVLFNITTIQSNFHDTNSTSLLEKLELIEDYNLYPSYE